MQISIIFLAALLSVASAAPTPPTSTSTAPSNRVTVFPACGIKGFTEEPGDHDLGIWPPPPVSKIQCILSCRGNSTCKAVSYAKEYSLCSYYGEYMKDDQLDKDDTSNFEHYDEMCPC